MTKEQFMNAMKLHAEILQKAREILDNHGLKDVVGVDDVILQGEDAIIKYTYKWDWEYDGDSFAVPLKEFIKEEQ
jgi:hypothetical protein